MAGRGAAARSARGLWVRRLLLVTLGAILLPGIRAAAHTGGELVAPLGPAPELRGDLSDPAWEGAARFRVSEFSVPGWQRWGTHVQEGFPPADDEDLSVEVRVVHDSVELFVAFRVWDDTVILDRRDGSYYLQDAVELFFEPLYGDGRFVQVFAAIDAADREGPFVTFPGARVAGSRVSDGYILEMAFPLAAFVERFRVPIDGDWTMGFDIQVDDADVPGAGRESALVWSGGENLNWQTAEVYGALHLPRVSGLPVPPEPIIPEPLPPEPARAGETAMAEPGRLVVNQVGYLPEGPKRAVLTVGVEGPTAWGDPPVLLIRRASTGRIVWQDAMTGPLRDRFASGDSLYVADFSSVTDAGRYVAEIAGGPRSPEFQIGPVYADVLYLTARSYFLQRCGIAIEDPVTGVVHRACHLEDGVLWRGDGLLAQGDRLMATGGWHDAGDYGKYATTTAVTAAQLLKAYELYPQAFADGGLDLPESGNGLPDVLDEALWGLEWLLAIQRPDGAVYHKLSGAAWPSMNTLPEEDGGTRYVYPITTQDTAKAAAAWAMAARVIGPWAPERAARFLDAALRAWAFLEGHGPILEYPAAANTGSGPYDDRDDRDDRLWAAVELWLATGDDRYHVYVRSHHREVSYTEVSWVNAAALGFFDYVTLGREGDPEVLSRAARLIRDTARSIFLDYQGSPYGVTVPFDSFAWASNKTTLARGMLLLLAYHLQPFPEYERVALAQLDYVLGLNPLGRSYVTGLGTHSPLNPHHRLVEASGTMVPGLLVGGPNNAAEDNVAPGHSGPRSYVDDTASYATNEPAIDYNAPLVFLAAHFASGAAERP